MTTRRGVQWIAALALVAGSLAYLHDPPWTAGVTSGLGSWQVDPSGLRYRWTNGHASFFIPSSARAATFSVRAGFPGPDGQPVEVIVSADDRPVDAFMLRDPEQWLRAHVLLPRRPTRRTYRRIDVRVNRTVGPSNRGVQLGEFVLEQAGS